MSMPKLPEIDPEMTRDRALDMILASIAMEEAALSHIINSEGEKLQYVLNMLETDCDDSDIEDLIRVNDSISKLLEMVSQNQMLLKNKMDKVLQFLPCSGSGTIGPRGPRGPKGEQGNAGPPGPVGCCISFPKCSAVFRGAYKSELWRAGCALLWNSGNIQGQCICKDFPNSDKIILCSKGRYMISFAANVKAELYNQCDVAVSLQMCSAHHRTDIFTVRSHISSGDTATTITAGGIIADTSSYSGSSSLRVNLVSPNNITVEDAVLNIVEINAEHSSVI